MGCNHLTPPALSFPHVLLFPPRTLHHIVRRKLFLLFFLEGVAVIFPMALAVTMGLAIVFLGALVIVFPVAFPMAFHVVFQITYTVAFPFDFPFDFPFPIIFPVLLATAPISSPPTISHTSHTSPIHASSNTSHILFQFIFLEILLLKMYVFILIQLQLMLKFHISCWVLFVADSL